VSSITVSKVKKKRKKHSMFKDVWRRLRKNKLAMAGLCVISLFAVVAVFADLIVPFSNGIRHNIDTRLLPPSSAHLFGTDAFGRDVFARMVHGSRVSLSIGLFTSGISIIIGGLLGAAAGYYGGKTDNIIMRFCDLMMCIPSILLALAIVAALGPGLRNMLIAITVASVPGATRMIRSVILTIVENDYIEAARACGTRDFRIIFRHILPNAMSYMIMAFAMGLAGMILSAAALSFIGMGILPPNPEWGAMLNEARTHMRTSGYLLYIPGGAILISVLSLNLLGDGLRDALDPRLKD